jgi:sigma-B regulation protein RsbU (phosphoserine phosphatase)
MSTRKRDRNSQVPLKHKGKVIGVVDLESTQIDYFTEYHERMLTMLASRIAAALVNAQLYARVSDNERRMDREMKIAREIQLQLMPEEVPKMEPLDIAVTFRPVAHLGGDLYDFITFDDGRLAFVVGDVTGKGAPAALYAALSSGIIRTRATRKYPPGQMLELVNKTLYSRPIESQYCALMYGIYDPQTKRIVLSNSGLPYPLLIRKGHRDSSSWPAFPLACSLILSIRSSILRWNPGMSWSSIPTVSSKLETPPTRTSD